MTLTPSHTHTHTHPLTHSLSLARYGFSTVPQFGIGNVGIVYGTVHVCGTVEGVHGTVRRPRCRAQDSVPCAGRATVHPRYGSVAAPRYRASPLGQRGCATVPCTPPTAAWPCYGLPCTAHGGAAGARFRVLRTPHGAARPAHAVPRRATAPPPRYDHSCARCTVETIPRLPSSNCGTVGVVYLT